MLTTKVYPNATVSDPSRNTKTGRLHVCIWLSTTKKSINLTLARYRMQEYLGRILESWEEVDHIDEDCTNDDLDNLQVLTKAENVSKTHLIYKESIMENCFLCNRLFKLSPTQQRQRSMNNKRTVGAFCSHSCAGKFENIQRK